MRDMLKRAFLPLIASILTVGPLAAQGFSPEEAVKRMQVPDGFQVRLIASEPMIRQPLTMTFDDRGRMWVIQYLQYPNPAGLKAVKVDQFLRTVYDRVPEPPPKGPKGADRVTILYDPDEHGRYRKSKDFVTGLNLASGLCLGHGGVYVLQSPYLLFYPVRDGEDVPSGDPEVLLSGFGMEDAHAVANSLQWGPDGWLYGAQGSTVTAKIRNPARPDDPPIEFQQGIWRYHPRTKEFELFSEGGGNTWGLDFDRHGNVIAGTNWGGKAMLHQVQGGYYIKGFGKHGPLHNPHTYGYFDHVPHANFKGGHVTCGGIIYQGGAYPEKFNDVYIAGNLLSNALYWHVLERKGSTFTAKFGGDFLIANDTWFRPIDCLTGPDGSVYVADWYDKRANHVDPVDNWDKTNGRIYKIEAKGAKPFKAPALGKLSSVELIKLLEHPNSWYRGEARRILAECQDRRVLPLLRKNIENSKGDLALESLWALYVVGGFTDDLALKLLQHENEDVRTWTIRFLGETHRLPAGARRLLERIAVNDTSPTVGGQLACTCKRLPAQDAVPILGKMAERDGDADDPFIPLLIWWAMEDKVIRDRELLLNDLLEHTARWDRPLMKRYLLERLARRYMAEETSEGMRSCARLLQATTDPAILELLLRGMDRAMEGRQLTRVPAELERPLTLVGAKLKDQRTLLRLLLRLGQGEAFKRVAEQVIDRSLPEPERATLSEALGQTGKTECIPVLLDVFRAAKTDALRGAALSALQSFNDTRIGETVLALYPKLSGSMRAKAQTLLCSRPATAKAFILLVDAGKVSPKEVPLDQLQRVMQYRDEKLAKIIEKHWGRIGAATAAEKIARIRALNHMMPQVKGDAVKGKELFKKTCAVCHTLFGEGTKLGPDLTGADRKNREWLLSNIVDPSAVIRPEFLAYVVNTTDGRTLTGLVVESTPSAVTLVNEKNERTIVPRDKIEEMKASPVSLMPEKILDPFDDQTIRDLFAYLQSDGAMGKK
jgi:putative membrane-bound dehydrogenase-like protein